MFDTLSHIVQGCDVSGTESERGTLTCVIQVSSRKAHENIYKEKKENHPKIPQKQSSPKAVNVRYTELTVHNVQLSRISSCLEKLDLQNVCE